VLSEPGFSPVCGAQSLPAPSKFLVSEFLLIPHMSVQSKKRSPKKVAVQNKPRPRSLRARSARSFAVNRSLGIDAFGQGWTEKSGMTGVGNTVSSRTSRRDMIIEESEFIGAVTVANQPNYNVTQYPINPGQASTFPWLSTIAKQYEKYVIERLAFIYKKEVSEYATAGQTGKVIMSVDYDAADAPPATKQQQEDTIPHADAMPC